jgi:hypothetical protein
MDVQKASNIFVMKYVPRGGTKIPIWLSDSFLVM